MTVSELIAELQALPNQDAIVILQRDAEGNGYSPLRGVDGESVYRAVTTYSGEAYATEDADEAGDTAVPCVVLHPVN